MSLFGTKIGNSDSNRVPVGFVDWGNIEGDITDQTDLVSYIASQISSNAGVGSLAFNTNPSNVDVGQMWTTDTEYGSCYWSAWVKPTDPNAVGYFASDGSGGAHNYLNGVETDASTALFTGNIYDGTQICSFSSADRYPQGEWVHYEFIYDSGVNTYILLNGICTFYGWTNDSGIWNAAFTGVRKTLPGGSNGHLYIGGSFHNNFPGQVAKLRGVEGSTAGVTTSNLDIPRDYNGYIGATRASFSQDFSVNGQRSFIDMGEGFEDRIHHGVFSRYDKNTAYPEWAEGEITPSTYVPTQPPTPPGAKVFDSFSRVNSLFLFGEFPTLGATEDGSAGPLTWKTAYFDGSNSGAGILYGQAVIYATQIAFAWVELGTSTADIRVTRPVMPWASTGILGRYKDAQNYYRISGSDTAITLEFMEAGVQTFPAGFTVTTGWTELKVTFSGTTMEVFVDGVSAGTKTVTNVAGATNHGISAAGAVSRYDDFTIF